MWRQFSLRALLAVITLLAIGLSWLANLYHASRQQQIALDRLKAAGDAAFRYPPLPEDTFGRMISEFQLEAVELQLQSVDGHTSWEYSNWGTPDSRRQAFDRALAARPVRRIVIQKTYVGNDWAEFLAELDELQILECMGCEFSTEALESVGRHPGLEHVEGCYRRQKQQQIDER